MSEPRKLAVHLRLAPSVSHDKPTKDDISAEMGELMRRASMRARDLLRHRQGDLPPIA